MTYVRSESILERYLEDNHLGFSENTLRTYKYHLERFLVHFESYSVDEISKRQIREWASLLFHKGNKPRTVRLALYSLRSFFRYCREENLVKVDPTKTIDLPKPEQIIPRVLNRLEIFKLREITKENLRDRLIFEVLYNTGVRVSELVNIKLDEINLHERRIDIPNSKGLKERYVIFTDDCRQRIREYLVVRNFDSSYLFVTHHNHRFSAQGIRKMLHDYSEKAGLSRRINPHDLRRTFATVLYNNNVPIEYIAQLMGHKTIATTLLYTRLNK